VPFTVRPSDVEELDRGEPGEVALENALRKARAVRAQSVSAAGSATETIIGVDTLVALDGVIYGKPADETRARATLRALGGKTHRVFSGLALLGEGDEQTVLVCTAVTFRGLDERMLDWYVATGEWRGRAGGYAIQGAGAALVRSVDGDYENVVGLPLASLLDLCPGLIGTV
jgi:septum formation protein